MENTEAYERAKRKVEEKFGFYIHLAVYIVVNVLLILISFNTYLWFKWPLLGWGVGVFFHAMAVSLFSSESAIKEQLIEREIKREALKKPR
jgi:hypothetical protein